MFVFQSISMNLFCRIYENLWDFIEGKRSSFKSLKNLYSGLLPVDRTVDRAVTDVHKCARPCLAGGPVDRPDRPPESSALWIWPRSTGRSTGRELLLSVSKPRYTSRSTSGTMVKNLTVGWSTGRSTGSRIFC